MMGSKALCLLLGGNLLLELLELVLGHELAGLLEFPVEHPELALSSALNLLLDFLQELLRGLDSLLSLRNRILSILGSRFGLGFVSLSDFPSLDSLCGCLSGLLGGLLAFFHNSSLGNLSPLKWQRVLSFQLFKLVGGLSTLDNSSGHIVGGLLELGLFTGEFFLLSFKGLLSGALLSLNTAELSLNFLGLVLCFNGEELGLLGDLSSLLGKPGFLPRSFAV
mmetsp:Transcript_28330/g.45146  ORF Transcript_28330/g.45146 Transcript_28330/m.45146 type:complete len:222 (+) Transcript_28330:205-870(+)